MKTITMWLIIATLAECSEIKVQNYNKVMSEIQHLTNDVASRYFFKARCIGVITEVPDVYLEESKLPVFYITVDRDTTTSDSLLLTAINAGCLGYILQVNDIMRMVEKFTKLFRSPSSVNRATRRYIYLPQVDTNEGVFRETMINKVFSSKSMNWMPDLLIVNLLMDQEVLGNKDYMKQIGSKRADTGADDTQTLIEKSRQPEFVLEVYTHKFVGDNPSETILLDVWVSDQGFIYGANLFPDKVKNLMGKELKTMSIHYPPFTVMIIDKDPPVYDGIEFQALFEFGKKHNATWRVEYDLENWWGDVWDNGSGVGLLGAIAEDRTDFVLCALYMIRRIFSYMDYSIPFYQSDVTAIVPKPQKLPDWLIPVLPFTSYMWYALLASVVIADVVFYIISKSSDALLGVNISSKYSSLLECSFRTIGMLVLQVPDDEKDYIAPRYVPLRHLVTWITLFFLITSSAYAGGLSSILTIPQFQQPIDTIKDLADSGLQWYGTDMAYLFTVLNSSNAALNTVVRNYIVRSEEELLRLGLHDNSSLLVERLQGGHFTSLKYITEAIVQNKRLMKEAIVPEHTVFDIAKGSAYKENFNSLLYKLRQGGIPFYWEGMTARKFLSERLQIAVMESREPSNVHHVKLGFSHVQGTFYLLAMGLLLALITFVLEHAKFHFTEKKKSERERCSWGH